MSTSTFWGCPVAAGHHVICPFGCNVVGFQAVVSIVVFPFTYSRPYRKGHMPAGRRFASVVAAASAAVVPVALTGTAGAVAAVHAPAAVETGGAGTWGAALTPPALSSLEQGAGAASSDVSVVSCASADNCSAAGYYPARGSLGGGNLEGYVVNEVRGTWRNVIKIAGITLSPRGGGIVRPLSVSCAKAGECSVVGDYEAAPPPAPFHAFITKIGRAHV